MTQPVRHREIDFEEHRRRLGQRIRALREDRRWSQDTFAQLTGMNRAYPHRIETGQVDVRYSTLLRIAQEFGMPVSELLADAPPPVASTQDDRS